MSDFNLLTTDFSRSFTEYLEEWIRFYKGYLGHGLTQMNTDKNNIFRLRRGKLNKLNNQLFCLPASQLTAYELLALS